MNTKQKDQMAINGEHGKCRMHARRGENHDDMEAKRHDSQAKKPTTPQCIVCM